MTLPEPQCWLGYPMTQVWDTLGPERFKDFQSFMHGQTIGICDGQRYDHTLEMYVDTCEIAHGGVAYAWDVHRFLAGLPVID